MNTLLQKKEYSSSSIKLDNKQQYATYKKIILYALLLFYGCIATYSIVKLSTLTFFYTELKDYYMSLRLDWLDLFINEVNETGIYTGLHRLYDHNASMYLYLSHFGSILGFDASTTFYYTQLIFVCGLVALYPIIVYRISNNVTLSVLSIFFFHFFDPFNIYLKNDSYWIYGWITFISVPILFFLFRDKWQKSNWIWVALLIGVVGVGNIFRANASLALIISLVVLMVVKIIYPATKTKQFKSVVLGCCICLIVFFANGFFTSTVPHIYQSVTNQPECLPMKGPWHSLYIGLGWEKENPLGLEYGDVYGYKNREDLLYDISDGYYIGVESPEYINEMKNVYFDTVFSNFIYCVGSYFRKVMTAIKIGFKFSIFNPTILTNNDYYINMISIYVFILSVIACGFFIKKSDKKELLTNAITLLGIVLVFFLFGLIPGVIATPIVREYTWASGASLDIFTFMIYITAVKTLIDFIKFLEK